MKQEGSITQAAQEMVRRLLQPTHDAEGWHALADSLNAETAAPLLSAALNDERQTLQARRQAATVLGMLRQQSSIPALSHALAVPDAVLRARVAEALGQFQDLPDHVVELLIQRLEDEDYLVREHCAKALAWLKKPQALPALQTMESADEVASNREAAKNAIRAIRGSN